MITTKFTCGLICFFETLLIVSYWTMMNYDFSYYDVTEIIIFIACFYST